MGLHDNILLRMGFGKILKSGGRIFLHKKKRKKEKHSFYLVLFIHSLPSCKDKSYYTELLLFFVPAFVSYLNSLSSLLFSNDTETISHLKQQ
jgi:hypothetical protein